MSSLPGYELEDFVLWLLDIKVVGKKDANTSLGLADMLGSPSGRPTLTEEQFKEVMELFEPYRDIVEDRLEDFDEETQSWRSFAGYSFEFIPDEVVETARQKIAQYD